MIRYSFIPASADETASIPEHTRKTPATPTNGSLFGNIPRQPAAPAKPAKKRDRLIDKIGARFNSALQNIMESDGKEEVGDLFGDDAFKNE